MSTRAHVSRGCTHTHTHTHTLHLSEQQNGNTGGIFRDALMGAMPKNSSYQEVFLLDTNPSAKIKLGVCTGLS